MDTCVYASNKQISVICLALIHYDHKCSANIWISFSPKDWTCQLLNIDLNQRRIKKLPDLLWNRSKLKTFTRNSSDVFNFLNTNCQEVLQHILHKSIRALLIFCGKLQVFKTLFPFSIMLRNALPFKVF